MSEGLIKELRARADSLGAWIKSAKESGRVLPTNFDMPWQAIHGLHKAADVLSASRASEALLADALGPITAACEEDCAGPGSEEFSDGEAVAYVHGKGGSALTFGMIRKARAALDSSAPAVRRVELMRDLMEHEQWQIMSDAIDRYNSGKISDLHALGLLGPGFVRLYEARLAALEQEGSGG